MDVAFMLGLNVHVVLGREEGEPFHGFSYVESYVRSSGALPLLASLPLAPDYAGAQALPFFEGLLPKEMPGTSWRGSSTCPRIVRRSLFARSGMLAKELRQPLKTAREERARLCDVLEGAFQQAAERAAGLGFGEAAPDLARRILFGAKIRMKVLAS